MDTSKKYIEMCQKAEEIQEEWKPKRGDFYTVVVHGKATDITNIYIDGFPSLPQRFIPLSELYVWLPRQDQLQEIYIGRNEDTLDRMFLLCKSFTDKTYVDHWKPWHFFDSMEQLWLAFVMKEKYDKRWNGKEWVK